MKNLLASLAFSLVILPTTYGQFFNKKQPMAHTFSIVARDSATGEMAVGVQSHWFSVGTAVSWGRAGTGVVATQSFVDKKYGAVGLQMMASGSTALQALETLLGQDEGREVRQVAMIDAAGHVAAHTGSRCIDFAGHLTGPNFSAQSNMMRTNRVNEAMAAAFRASYGRPLAHRVMAALNEAQLAGGDIRGKQSAALLVVKGNQEAETWNGNLVDLRVDDHPRPLEELNRLLQVHTAYEHMNAGDVAVEKGDMPSAMRHYGAAMKMFPANLEMQYWTAITLANNGKTEKAAAMLQKIYSRDPNWRELTRRLPKAGLLSVSEKVLLQLTK